MKSEWRTVALGSVADLTVGFVGTMASNYTETGIPFLRSTNIEPFDIKLDDIKYISSNFNESLRKSELHPNDVVIVRTGTPGACAVIPAGVKAWNCSDLVIVRPHRNKLNPLFLASYVNLASGVINTQLVGAVQQHYNVGAAKKMQIPLPPIGEQDKIASIIGMLNKKITINSKINDNLQQQAFAAFDNLVANAENTDCNVSDYAFLNPKRALAKNQMARSIDMSRLSTSRAFPSGWEMKPFAGGMRFTNGDTLLARITPCLENGKTAFIDFLDDGEVAFGSTEYIVLAPKNDTPPEMLYCLARNPAFIDYAVKNMNGSSGRQRVSAETVGQYRLPLFDKHSLSIFRKVVSPMFLKMRYNSLENMRLAELRDELLPKLMSGEIGVSNIRL